MKNEECLKKTNINLEEIINQYTGYLYSTITNMTKGNLSSEDIEEIVSDVFLVFWKNREKFDESRELRCYLLGIASNLIKEKFRKFKITYNIEDYESIFTDSKDINIIYEENEKMNIIEKVLNKNTLEDRTVFVMFYYNSKKIKEIAEELKISEFAVKSKLHRMRRKIKKELESEGYSYGQ